jgi:DNA-binding YbaB/EbfC family protein
LPNNFIAPFQFCGVRGIIIKRKARKREKELGNKKAKLEALFSMKMNNVVKQAQKMQAQMLQIQEQLAEERVEGNAGGGMVKAIVTGHGDLLEIKLDPEVVQPGDVEMLEDLIVVAVNDGLHKSKELANSRMGVIAGALGSMGLSF